MFAQTSCPCAHCCDLIALESAVVPLFLGRNQSSSDGVAWSALINRCLLVFRSCRLCCCHSSRGACRLCGDVVHSPLDRRFHLLSSRHRQLAVSPVGPQAPPSPVLSRQRPRSDSTGSAADPVTRQDSRASDGWMLHSGQRHRPADQPRSLAFPAVWATRKRPIRTLTAARRGFSWTNARCVASSRYSSA